MRTIDVPAALVRHCAAVVGISSSIWIWPEIMLLLGAGAGKPAWHTLVQTVFAVGIYVIGYIIVASEGRRWILPAIAMVFWLAYFIAIWPKLVCMSWGDPGVWDGVVRVTYLVGAVVLGLGACSIEPRRRWWSIPLLILWTAAFCFLSNGLWGLYGKQAAEASVWDISAQWTFGIAAALLGIALLTQDRRAWSISLVAFLLSALLLLPAAWGSPWWQRHPVLELVLGVVGVGLSAALWFPRPSTHVSFGPMPLLLPRSISTRDEPWPVAVKRWLLASRQWEISEDWCCTLGSKEIVISKKRKFVFDGASIPRPFWVLLNPIGLLLIPGLLHDYGYRDDVLHLN